MASRYWPKVVKPHGTPAFNAGAQSTTGPSYAGGRIFVRNVEEMVAYGLQANATAGVNP